VTRMLAYSYIRVTGRGRLILLDAGRS